MRTRGGSPTGETVWSCFEVSRNRRTVLGLKPELKLGALPTYWAEPVNWGL